MTGNFYDTVGNVELGDDLGAGDSVLSSYNDSPMGNVNEVPTVLLRAQYTEELKQIEEEIQTLRQVLLAKYRRQQFLKRQLGITVISELRDEVNRGVDTIRTSDAYQKTTAVVKSAKEKTSAALYDKWNYLKQTNAFKSFEDKLETAYSSVRLPASFSSLALTAPQAMNRLVRSATITASHPSVPTESANQIAEPNSPPPQSAYSLDGNEEIHENSSPNRKPITLEELDAEYLGNDHSVTEPVVASDVGAGDQRKPGKQNRPPRKK